MSAQDEDTIGPETGRQQPKRMSFFERLLGKPSSPTPKPVEHCLIVHFQYGQPSLNALYEQADRLREALLKAGAGEYDGHEVAISLSDGFHYVYGPNADRLLEVVEPVLRSTPWFLHAEITRRYGPPEDGVRRVVSKYSAQAPL